jgi:hypothetical protein
MAVFVSASDESSGKNQRDTFLFAGWVGPEEDWSRFFVPAWQERVLDGPPPIPYLHMTDMRRRQWLEDHGLTKLVASDRIDEAVLLLDTMANFYPIAITIDGAHFRDETKGMKIKPAPGMASTEFEPDYICFLAYARLVLGYIEHRHPEAEKVDFIVEMNGKITKHIQKFHANLTDSLKYLGKDSLARLVGQLIPAEKDRTPLQAADLFCWHVARARKPEMMDANDFRRYSRLANRVGCIYEFPKDTITELTANLLRLANTGPLSRHQQPSRFGQ